MGSNTVYLGSRKIMFDIFHLALKSLSRHVEVSSMAKGHVVGLHQGFER